MVYLLPSHPEDHEYAIGGPERYIPVSSDTLKSIYKLIGIDFEPLNPRYAFKD